MKDINKPTSELYEKLKRFNIMEDSEICIVSELESNESTESANNTADIKNDELQREMSEKVINIERNLTDVSSSYDTFTTNSSISITNEYTNRTNTDEYNVEHVLDFVKVSEVETYGHSPPADMEPLLEKRPHIQRLMLFQDLSRHVFADRVAHRVAYDLDELVRKTSSRASLVPPTNSQSTSRASTPLRKSQSAPKIPTARRGSSTNPLKDEILKTQPLTFESRFECGNLRKAVQIRHYEYDLILNSDTNSSSHHQWFYFQVENMEIDIEYRFNIVNCEKSNSQFNYGMQPVFYSVQEAKRGNPSWERLGTNVCYYRNCFSRGSNSIKTYFTGTFTISFPYKNDTCYLAYHYPYTLSTLKLALEKLESNLLPLLIYKNQVLCETLGGNDVNLITITNPSSQELQKDINKRPYIVLTARVHPGESNSSWVMEGILNFLTSTDIIARQLRSIFIFKIIPMLNPDGVVNGNHRCSLTGQDLNRQWKDPDPVLHPSIYQVKALIQTMTSMNKKPLMFVDFHGHSRKKNVFMYGCQEEQNSNSDINTNESVDSLNYDLYPGETSVKLFPRIISSVSPYFSLQNCNYTMDKSKEATARMVGFKELGIDRCYTLESTYCGMDQGEFAGYHVNTRELEDMGRSFCKALFKLAMYSNVDLYDTA